jgi:glc operon protein GlcG
MPRRMTRFYKALLTGLAGSVLVGTAIHAQMLDKKAISLAEAKRMVAAAEAEAKKNNWGMCIAVVDDDGNSILSEKMDDCQVGSVDVALSKARTAARFRRPTKAFEDFIVKDGRTNLITLGVMAVEGGLNIVVDGKTVGAIGCSGGSSVQDGMTCKAGLEAMAK